MDVMRMRNFDHAMKRLFGQDEFRCWSSFGGFRCMSFCYISFLINVTNKISHCMHYGGKDF